MVSTRSTPLKAIELPFPARLLVPRANTWTPSQTEETSTARPVQQSRLLALPGELRTRIYEYVLGGNTLHLTCHHQHLLGPRISITLCVADVGDYDAAIAMRQNPKDTTIPSYQQRHAACRWGFSDATRRATHLNVSIVLTCRQVHQEAALIPFAKNDFATHQRIALSGLPRMLSPMQQQSIGRLILFRRFAMETNIKVGNPHIKHIKRLVMIYQQTQRNIKIDDESGQQFLWVPSHLEFPALQEAIFAVHPNYTPIPASVLGYSEQRLLQR